MPKNSLIDKVAALVDQRQCPICDKGPDTFNFDVFERAADLIAKQLAFFRKEGSEPTKNEKLTAGHLAGNLSANGLLVSEMPVTPTSEQSDGGSH